MSTCNVGIRSGNVIVPYVSSTKRTKWIDISSAVSCSPTFTAVTAAKALFYADSAGVWRARINIRGTVASGSRTGATITIANLVFKSTSGYYGPASGFAETAGASVNCIVYATFNTGTIGFEHASATTTTYAAFVDFELNAEPTTYTTAANMEGVIAADVYIANANSTTPGLLTKYVPWTTFTPSFVKSAGAGTLTSVSLQSARWSRVGNIVSIQIYANAITVTSNTITLNFTLPVAPVYSQPLFAYVYNGGDVIGRVVLNAGSTTTNIATTAWAVANTGEFSFSCSYEVA